MIFLTVSTAPQKRSCEHRALRLVENFGVRPEIIVFTWAAMIEFVRETSKGLRRGGIRLCDPMRLRFAMSHEWRDVNRVVLNVRAWLAIAADRLGWPWFGCHYLNVDFFQSRLSSRLSPTCVYITAVGVGACQLRVLFGVAGQ